MSGDSTYRMLKLILIWVSPISRSFILQKRQSDRVKSKSCSNCVPTAWEVVACVQHLHSAPPVAERCGGARAAYGGGPRKSAAASAGVVWAGRGAERQDGWPGAGAARHKAAARRRWPKAAEGKGLCNKKQIRTSLGSQFLIISKLAAHLTLILILVCMRITCRIVCCQAVLEIDIFSIYNTIIMSLHHV